MSQQDVKNYLAASQSFITFIKDFMEKDQSALVQEVCKSNLEHFKELERRLMSV